eukprot:XP_001702657.1 predicted protein [Chlamydomonas reinhardtii]
MHASPNASPFTTVPPTPCPLYGLMAAPLLDAVYMLAAVLVSSSLGLTTRGRCRRSPPPTGLMGCTPLSCYIWTHAFVLPPPFSPLTIALSQGLAVPTPAHTQLDSTHTISYPFAGPQSADPSGIPLLPSLHGQIHLQQCRHGRSAAVVLRSSRAPNPLAVSAAASGSSKRPGSRLPIRSAHVRMRTRKQTRLNFICITLFAAMEEVHGN